jgi:hypothetical protein
MGSDSTAFPNYPEYWFEFGNVSATQFSAYSPYELLQAPITEFGSLALNPSACSVRISMPDWTVCGARTMTITARNVAEPSSLALFCFGLVGIAVMRRRRSG